MDAERDTGGRSPNILLVNVHSSWNAGDDALTREAVRQLKEQLPQASIILAMNDPASYQAEGKAIGSFMSWVKPIGDATAPSRWKWTAFPGLLFASLLALVGYRLCGSPWFFRLRLERRCLLEAYLRADIVISCAGGFLYSSGKVGLPLLLSLFSILYAWLAGKPLYSLPQTLGPIRRKWERLLARLILSKMRFLMVRDTISANEWKRWGGRDSALMLVPDIAFCFSSEEGRPGARALLEEYGVTGVEGRPCLGVTLIEWGAQDQRFFSQTNYENAVVAAIRAFLSSYGGSAVLFAQVHGPTTAEDDRVPARRVLARLPDLAHRVVMIDRWVPPQVLKAAYGQMDLFLGTRLHSNIFALAENVPAIAIGYQYKTRGALQMLELEQWTVNIDQVTDETLVTLLHQAWVARERTQAKIQTVIPEIQHDASQAGALIASDFLSLQVASRAG